jgi:hypothetical protein
MLIKRMRLWSVLSFLDSKAAARRLQRKWLRGQIQNPDKDAKLLSL